MSNTFQNLGIDGLTITTSECEKLIRAQIDRELDFRQHVILLCKSTCQKLNAFLRLAYSMTHIILNSIIRSNFSSCPMVQIFHSRNLNENINNIHERNLEFLHAETCVQYFQLFVKTGAWVLG